jgi:Spy/CpxP family protein refolding chaperone
MNTISSKTIVGAAAILVGLVSAASANGVEDRQTYQFGRIEEGRQEGSITWREGIKLRQEQQRIKNMETYLEDRHGRLSKSNRRYLNQLQNEASENIEDKKDNGQYRPSWLPRVGR